MKSILQSRAALALTLVTALTLSAGPALAQELPDFAALVRENGPAVVSVRVDKTVSNAQPSSPFPPGHPFNEFFKRFEDGMPKDRQVFGQGSGFVIDREGYILTNAHVVKGADEVVIAFEDRRELTAEVIGLDERTDVALLKVEANDLPAVTLGNADDLSVGDWVLAIGNPFGLEQSATQGIVSALSRNLPSDTYVPFIQTDAAVNPGNSGGPLFNTDGEVVGINSQIYSRSGGYMGVSFAIPINVAMNVADQLRESGSVSRGWLGVTIQDLNQDLAQSFGLDRPRGALVAQVQADSPAAEAGLESGDVILSYNGRAIDRSGQLPVLVGNTKAGERAELTVLRNGDEQQIPITVGELPADPTQLAAASTPQGGRLGVAVEPLDGDASGDDPGVRVAGVNPDSPAASAGIREGDVIVSFNRKPVRSPQELAELVNAAEAGKPVVLLIERDGNNRFVPVQLG